MVTIRACLTASRAMAPAAAIRARARAASWGSSCRAAAASAVTSPIRLPTASCSRLSWLVAGLLLAAEVLVRAAVVGQPYAPAWFGVLVTIAFYVDNTMVFFGVTRMAQIVGEVEDARDKATGLAVTRERLQAARWLLTLSSTSPASRPSAPICQLAPNTANGTQVSAPRTASTGQRQRLSSRREPGTL
jgi:hypothetical protein